MLSARNKWYYIGEWATLVQPKDRVSLSRGADEFQEHMTNDMVKSSLNLKWHGEALGDDHLLETVPLLGVLARLQRKHHLSMAALCLS